MLKLRTIAAIITLAAATIANADTFNKKTKVTFSGPVEVPNAFAKNGTMVLPAGTYVFRLLDSQSSRHIVEVTNLRQDHVYTTILAVPDYRVNATSKTVMYFTESKAGAAPPIKAWFYPGDNTGQRFVYPKAKATEIAAAVNQPVPFHEAPKIEKANVEQIPVQIQTPAKQQVAYAPATFDKVDATDTAGVDGEAVTETAAAKPSPTQPARTLPKTASPIPLIGLFGLSSLVAGLLLRRLSPQPSK
jgi:hypothetical protein